MSATLTLPKPPTKAAPRLMTAEEFWDYCQLPENTDRNLELVRGVVTEMSQPTMTHGIIQINIGAEFKAFCRRSGHHFVASESGLILRRKPDSVRGPDVAVYEYQDGKRFIPKKWSIEPPLIAVEIMSPNDKPSVVAFKTSEYLQNGVGEVWLIDADDRTVTRHFKDAEPATLTDADAIETPLLPGFRCAVSIIFEDTEIEETDE